MVPNPFRLASCAALSLSALCAPGAMAADPDPDVDALSLTSASPETVAPAGAARNKLFVEGALGVASPRSGGGDHAVRRLSVDFTHTSRLSADWRVAISDRLDYVRPLDSLDLRSDGIVNSLREAYVSWQPTDSNTAVDAGRVNLRYGPGYGYNPTDFFRDGSLRVVTSTNPLALRENRLGTVVLRGQQLWNGGSIAAVYSPKLASGTSDAGESLDLGATNHRHRGAIVLGNQWSDKISTQVLLYKEAARRLQLGASMTALLGDATVGHIEWSRAHEPDVLAGTTTPRSAESTRNRLAAGLTYNTAFQLSVTAEYEYNGFAPDRTHWDRLDLPSRGAVLLVSRDRQDLASRQGWLIYATQKSLGLKALDLTAFLRTDSDNRSRLAWVELRHHWDRVDLALQYQQQTGRVGTEYWLYPDKRSVQLLASYFF